MKRETPYSRLRSAVLKYISRVNYPQRATMFVYQKDRLDEGWSLRQLAERTAAADQLGFDTRLKIDSAGNLVVEYAKRPREIDYTL
jgi:hypothetical protein